MTVNAGSTCKKTLFEGSSYKMPRVKNYFLVNIGGTVARCNNFAFELHNFLSKENKPKQNITFGSPFSKLEKLGKKEF